MIGGKAKGPGAAGPSFHCVRRTGSLVDRVPMDGLAHPRTQLEHGPTFNELLLQLQFSIGAHGAHPF